MKMFIYPTPENATCTLRHDQGWSAVGVPDTNSEGRKGQSFTIPAGTPAANGAELNISADGYVPIHLRGLVVFDTDRDLAYILCDDFHLQLSPVTPPTPEPPPTDEWPKLPFDICQKVYRDGNFNLASPVGCGLYTEACATALHEHHHPSWGHVRKNPGQNQFNGHAVDAVQLLVNTMDTQAGIYDIIKDSASMNAEPSFNYSGPPAPDLWYYPAAPIVTE